MIMPPFQMAPSAFDCFICCLSAVLFAPAIADDPINVLPHSSCDGSPFFDEPTVSCMDGNYSLPGNFEMSLISTTVGYMYLGHRTPDAGLTSYIHDNADPLPSSLSRLWYLGLYTFEGTNSTRVPLEAFLVNVKRHLIELDLQHCRINPLQAGFLKGFNKLQNLDLADNDIRDIDVNAFEVRVSLQENILPALQRISLKRNPFTSLDWAVFAPVAHSLETLSLMHEWNPDESPTSLTLSKSFTFANLTTLDLRYSRQNFLPRNILDTLTISDRAVIQLDDNEFCPWEVHAACTCCEAEDFIKWAHTIALGAIDKRPTVSFTCGNASLTSSTSWSMSSTHTNLPALDQYKECFHSSSGIIDLNVPATTFFVLVILSLVS